MDCENGLDYPTKNNHYAPVAQLDRALVFGTRCWGFELLQVHQNIDFICFLILLDS